ncbi:phospholipase [Micromonospora sp. A202]|uniref:phospholipase n=1 Tax=Micromonospora sp. A202 TaxID=2572899 RepID=UPI00114D4F95|nr:phospholipase [Micromonospora sp. A202]
MLSTLNIRVVIAPLLCERISRMQPSRVETPFLDAIEAELKEVSPGMRGRIWERTDGNALGPLPEAPGPWLLQVPNCWGSTTVPSAKPGVTALLDRIRTTIAQAQRTVDITSFGVPSLPGSPAGAFPDGKFAEVMGAGLGEAAVGAKKAGRRLTVRVLTGVLGIDWTADPWVFRNQLMQAIEAAGRAAGLVDIKGVVDINVAAMTTRGISSYNHTKFVLVDGEVVIHGGINWMTNYYIEDGTLGYRGFGGTAPVTDADIVLSGPAAASAGRFLDELWTWAVATALTEEYENYGGRVWLATKNDDVAGCIPNLYKGVAPKACGNLTVLAVGSLGYGIKERDEKATTYQPLLAGDLEQAACTYPLDNSNNETNTDRDFMTVNPDANALRVLIANAKRNVVLSQQDICGFNQFPLFHALFDVRLIDALILRMQADVKVRIVISNPGRPDYSNTSHLDESYAVLYQRARLRTGGHDRAIALLANNLQLAPLRVSAEPTWPGGYKYRLHTKIVMVDDVAFYIGSRNVYPDTTQDHGFFIEDAAAAEHLKTAFLDLQWKWSKAAALINWEEPVLPPYHFENPTYRG